MLNPEAPSATAMESTPLARYAARFSRQGSDELNVSSSERERPALGSEPSRPTAHKPTDRFMCYFASCSGCFLFRLPSWIQELRNCVKALRENGLQVARILWLGITGLVFGRFDPGLGAPSRSSHPYMTMSMQVAATRNPRNASRTLLWV